MMRALIYWYALVVRMAEGSLHDHDPLHADEPPIMRGDAPPGMFHSAVGRVATDLWD